MAWRILAGCLIAVLAERCADGQRRPAEPVPDLTALSIEELMQIKVDSAALQPRTIHEAPASVTVLTAEDLYKYGYRTLGEALASVRGFYPTYDRTYRSIGVRGFGLPGDYGGRILVMVNGHNMADRVFDSMLWLGVDFPVDMALVKRIEIVRGPTSALYGSNGMFATINVVTKTPEDRPPPQVTIDAGSFGEKKLQMSGTLDLGKNVRALVSGTLFDNAGESPLLFPQFNANQGRAVRMDGENGYHLFSNLVWKNWTVTAVLSRRTKIQPVSWGDTVFNDRGTKVIEPSGFVEAVYTRQAGDRMLRWRTYYSAAHLRGRFDYPLESTVEDNRTCSCSDSIGSQVTYGFETGHFGFLTVGAEAAADLRTLQSSQDVSPTRTEFVHIDRRDKSLALFAQDERPLSRRWKLDLGLRLDVSAYRRSFVSPRAALIYGASRQWTYKLLYGRAFRNPSVFDLFYDDGLSAVANPGLGAENVDTVEANVERNFGKGLSISTAVYGYWLRDFLAAVYTYKGLVQYQNSGGAHAAGLEFEITARPSAGLEVNASYAWQRSSDSVSGLRLPNSANHQTKLRVGRPLGSKLYASSTLQFYSPRKTLAGAWLTPIYLADFTVSSRQVSRRVDVQFGLRNAFNHRYSDPIALNPRVDSMQQPGRTFFVEVIGRL